MKSCVVCGSAFIKTGVTSLVVYPLLGLPTTIEVVEDTCTICFERGDFDCVNDVPIMAAFEAATKAGAVAALDKLNAAGFSDLSIECALGLKFGRTVRAWRAGDFALETPALLRVLADDPSLLTKLNAPWRGHKP